MWIRKVTAVLGVLAVAEVSAIAFEAPLKVRVNHHAFEKTFARHDQEMVKGLKNLESGGPNSVSISTRHEENDFNFKFEVNENGISVSSN